ncbi:MAG: preprotein translocase subunit YajC [Clostridia bacterium]|nr:preprotein translocase subunit YajC [Clostridia bacterium]
MIFNLLADSEPQGNSGWVLYVVLAAVIVLFVVWMFFSNKKGKKRQQEYIEQLEAIQPGHKVKTVGGICGIVVEVCDDNTVIIETGTELSGKSYVKMDKEAIAQTDAKGPTQIAREAEEERRRQEKEAKKNGTALPAEEAKEEPAEEPAPEEKTEEPAEEPEEKE